MTLTQAIGFELPRRRAGSSEWDTPDEFLWYPTYDIVAEDWEVKFPNGRIISDFAKATTYVEGLSAPLRLVRGGFDGNNSGSFGTTSVGGALGQPLRKLSQ